MKKELLPLFVSTPDHHYYIYETETLKCIIEKLSFGRFSLLTTLQADRETASFVDHLFIHHSDFVKRSYVDHQELCIVFKAATTKENFLAVMKELHDYIDVHHLLQVCNHCHEVKPLSYVHNEETIDLLCDDCFTSLTETSYPVKSLGLLSAIVLCIFPAIVWPVLHDLGYPIILDGILFGICSFKGFLLLGENIDRKGLGLSFLAVVITLSIAQLFAFAFEITQVFQTNFKVTISLSQGFAALPDFWGADLLGVALTYIIPALMFTLITLFVLYRNYKKRHNHRHAFEKLTIDYEK